MFKENSTLLTVFRGLLAFLTTIGTVALSSYRSPTLESKQIWLAVGYGHNYRAQSNGLISRESLRLASRIKGGPLRIDFVSLSTFDLTKLMVDSEDKATFDTQFALQACLLTLVMSGTGLRIGSFRNTAKVSQKSLSISI